MMSKSNEWLLLFEKMHSGIIIDVSIIENKRIEFECIHTRAEISLSCVMTFHNVDHLYFKQFHNGVERLGKRNLHRFDLDIESEKIEWIDNLSQWTHPITHEPGVELTLLSGKI